MGTRTTLLSAPRVVPRGRRCPAARARSPEQEKRSPLPCRPTCARRPVHFIDDERLTGPDLDSHQSWLCLPIDGAGAPDPRRAPHRQPPPPGPEAEGAAAAQEEGDRGRRRCSRRGRPRAPRGRCTAGEIRRRRACPDPPPHGRELSSGLPGAVL
ncbi:unnamed protein product [Urochloa humidicola]